MRVIVFLMLSIATGFSVENARMLFMELATPGTSPERRDELVTQLWGAKFSDIGIQAAQTICSTRPGRRSKKFDITPGIYNPRTEKPWLEKGCPEQQKVFHATYRLWESVIWRAEHGSLAEPLAKLCREERPIEERGMYLHALLRCHYHERVKTTLKRIARDKTQPPEISFLAARVLFQKENGDSYTRTLIESCERIPDVERRSALFRFGGSPLYERLSPDSKKMLLNYGFALLNQVSDGSGYFLSSHLGQTIGIETQRVRRNPFRPDQHLPKYRDKHGNLNDAYFQDTVKNAKEWWSDNQRRFQ